MSNFPMDNDDRIHPQTSSAPLMDIDDDSIIQNNHTTALLARTTRQTQDAVTEIKQRQKNFSLYFL